MQEYIARLDVPMHDIKLDEYLKGLHEILEIVHGLLLREPTIPLDLLLEGSSITILIHEIVVIGSLEYFNKSHHMSGIFNLGKRLYLVDGELL